MKVTWVKQLVEAVKKYIFSLYLLTKVKASHTNCECSLFSKFSNAIVMLPVWYTRDHQNVAPQT